MKLPSPSDYATHCMKRKRYVIETEYVKLIQYIADRGARVLTRKRTNKVKSSQ